MTDTPETTRDPADSDAPLRAALADHWRQAALDLVGRGLPPDAVFEALLAVGAAGLIESRGRRDAARRLLGLAEHLAGQLRREAEAVDEARRATKN